MFQQFWWSSLTCLLAAGSCAAQVRIEPKTTFAFASLDEGRKLLMERDAFIAALSPFDRSARMKTDQPVDEQAFLDFIGSKVRAWRDVDKSKVDQALAVLKPRLEALALPFPETIHLVTTTGEEEGGATYTRGDTIVLVADELGRSVDRLAYTLSHELFHIVSRANARLKERCYGAIGFVGCDEPELPPELDVLTITNPDAPANNHCIHLQFNNDPVWGIPILVSSRATYDVARDGPFFQYVQLKMLLVEKTEGSPRITPLRDGTGLRLVEVAEVTGFLEQVGRNTAYIIHPEEILADNFQLLVMGQEEVPSPEVLRKLRAALAQP